MITRARRRQGPVAAAPRLRRRSSSTCRASLNDINLAFLDASDTIIEIVTYDSTTIHNTIAMADTFRVDRLPGVEGPLPRQPGRLVGRHRPRRPRAGARPRARAPRRLRRARSSSRRTTRACRSSSPTRTPQSARTSRGSPSEILGPVRPRRRRRARARRGRCPIPRPIGVFDSGVGGLTVLREILRRSPAESTIYLGDNARAPYGVRPDDEVLAFSTQALDALVERDVKALVVACNTSTAVALGRLPPALRPAGPRRDPARRGRGGPGDPQPAGRGDRHAGDDPLARLLRGDQGREPGRRGLRARDAGARAAGRGRPAARAEVEATVARRWRRCSASATPTASSIFPRPPGADDRHAAARLHPLPAAAAAHRGGRRRPGIAIVDSATATASALAELLDDQRPRGAGDGERRRTGASGPPCQLTTGDVDAVPATSPAASSATDFPDVEPRSSSRVAAR